MDNPNPPDDAPPPSLPDALKAYLDLDFAPAGEIAKQLLDRADDEAAKDEIALSDIVGPAPANLTQQMLAWYQARVSPDRNAALQAICQLYRDQFEAGKADGFILPLRLGTLENDHLRDKLKFYQDHNERFYARAQEIKETKRRLLDARYAYETRKAQLGREPLLHNGALYFAVMLIVVFGAEAAINLESFKALPWATPAIAWGITIMVGAGVGLAAHFHGLVYRQYAFYFGPAVDDARRGSAWRMFAIGSTILTVALSVVYYARSAYFAAYMSSVGGFGQSNGEGSLLWVVGGSLLGNVLVYLVGTLWAYMMHDEDPEYPPLKLEVDALEAKRVKLEREMETARLRGLEQMAAKNRNAVEASHRMSQASAGQLRYRLAQEQFGALVRKDDAVLAILLAYRAKLTGKAAALGKRTRFVAYNDDPYLRQQNLSAAEYERLPMKLKYLEA